LEHWQKNRRMLVSFLPSHVWNLHLCMCVWLFQLGISI
jgi:hypothetical protein